MALNNTIPPTVRPNEPNNEPTEPREEDELDANRDQREVACKLSHYVHALLCIISNQMTNIENLQAQLGELKRNFFLIICSFTVSKPLILIL